MLPDDDDEFLDRHESIAFVFTVALAGLFVTLILAWVTA